MQVTKRNHYNPCFWTAHWNTDYDKCAIAGETTPDPRAQQVFALNVRVNNIFHRTVENVHYDKNFGIAEIMPQAAKDFCRRNFPDKYAEFCQEMTRHPETLYLDFEPILTGLEQTPAYRVLLDVIVKQRVDTADEKAFLASFVYIHCLRGHAIMNSMVQLASKAGIEKFEYFLQLKHILGDTNYLFAQVLPLTTACWNLYNTETHSFPLCDSPILGVPQNILVALSPRLLLEIDLTMKASPDSAVVARPIKQHKLLEFRNRTIGNTFREIIFSDKGLLESWMCTPEFQDRHKLVFNLKSYNALVATAGSRELWKVNAFGNRQ